MEDTEQCRAHSGKHGTRHFARQDAPALRTSNNNLTELPAPLSCGVFCKVMTLYQLDMPTVVSANMTLWSVAASRYNN